jgi:hypothetical protein
MLSIRYSFSLLLVLILTCCAFAQEETLPVIAEQPLFSTLLGSWEGEGWSMQGPDQRVEFKQTEQIEAKADGHVVTIEGTGRDPESGDVSFEAYAVVAYDGEQKLIWTAYNNGNILTLEPTIADNSLTWGFPVEGGEIRYTITVEGNRWTEVGEFSSDAGSTWVQTFEMNLTKVE